MPIDYTKSKIYKIVCNETGETYYGSTVQTLATRLSKHKNNFKIGKKTTSIQIIERDNYVIVLCEEYPCKNKEQLLSRERFWIENNECVNKQIPIRYETEKKEVKQMYNKINNQKSSKKSNNKEWKKLNPDKCKSYQKKWRDNNKEYEKEENRRRYLLRKQLKQKQLE